MTASRRYPPRPSPEKVRRLWLGQVRWIAANRPRHARLAMEAALEAGASRRDIGLAAGIDEATVNRMLGERGGT